MAGHFLTYNNAAYSGGNDGGGREVTQLFRKQAAHLRCSARILKKKRALEKFTAVKSAAQDEVSMKKSTGFTEEFKNGVHG
jgi:hypothetical protein